MSVQVTGQGGVPATGVSAVVVNVTAVAPTAAGYITVWPSGTPRQETSNLNFQAGQNIPNLVIVPVGADGKIQLFNGSGGTVHLLADVTGYILGGTPDHARCGGLAAAGADHGHSDRIRGCPARCRRWGTVSVQVTGQGGVPADRGVRGRGERHRRRPDRGRVHHGVAVRYARQETSNLNFQAGQNIPNLVIVPVGADGKIQLFNGSAGTVHLIADVAGYILGG